MNNNKITMTIVVIAFILDVCHKKVRKLFLFRLTVFLIFFVELITPTFALDLIVATDQSLTFKDIFYEDSRNFTISLVDNLKVGDKFALIGFGDKAKMAFRPLTIKSSSDRTWLKEKVSERFPKPTKKITYYKPAFSLAGELFRQWESSKEDVRVFLIITDDKGSDLNKTLPEESDINVPKIMKITDSRYTDYLVIARIYNGSYITTRFLNTPASYRNVVAKSKSISEVLQKVRKPQKASVVDTNDKKITASNSEKNSLMENRKKLFIAAGSGLIVFVIILLFLIKGRDSDYEQNETDEEDALTLVLEIVKDGEGTIEEIELKRGQSFEISSKLTADLFIDDITAGFSLDYDRELLISPLILSDGIEIINEGEPSKKLEGGESEEIFFGTVIKSGDYSIKVEGGENER